jgi:hypothetical protein
MTIETRRAYQKKNSTIYYVPKFGEKYGQIWNDFYSNSLSFSEVKNTEASSD